MDYKQTLQLPKTAFPMRGELPKREPLILKHWQDGHVYEKIQEKRKDAKPFVFHLGPPFANGDAHIGHVLSFTLKDVVAKARNMSGFSVPLIPGWDCHGLPIEFKVAKDLGDQGTDPILIRQKSAEMAKKYIDIQRGQFKRLGILADWENPYITMDPSYEADVLRSFGKIVGKGFTYQGLRPVSWSTGCQTALAEAEVEYLQKTDPAIFVKFQLTQKSVGNLQLTGNVSFLVWTTTPWTLPANLALAVSGSLIYEVYRFGDEQLIVAKDLVSKIPNFENAELVQSGISGETLALENQLEYQHPFLDRTGKIFKADFVTADTGSGIVHIAPGHGADDYFLGMQHGLKPFSPVDDRGCLTGEAGVPELAGQYVFKANPIVIELLKQKNRLWAQQDYVHDYPHCWRSKTPIVFRSVQQWFIKVDAFRQQALDEIDKVNWIPAWGRNRIHGAIASRPDWCISRQTLLGEIPIPAFFNEKNEAVMTEASVAKFAELVEKEGTDVWFKSDADSLAERLGLPKGLRKGRDTLDVWIDSGSSHAAVVRRRLSFPADLYLEGSDQHRGWFNSSLSISVMLTGEAPYRSVLTHGFIVDEHGKKYSKSSGATDSNALIAEHGADVLRLWVSSQDYTNDVPFSKNILSRVADTYRSMRNTLRILLANLDGFEPAQAVAAEDLHEVDRYILGRLQELIREVRGAYERYEFSQVYQLINRFCAVDLSALYVDVLKDRMYCDAAGSPRRRSSQTAMNEILSALSRLLAPITPFTAEEAWQFAESKHSDTWQTDGLVRESVHAQEFPEAREIGHPEGFALRWEKLLELRTAANEQLEGLRREKVIGKNLEAAVEVTSPDFCPDDADLLAEVLIVSRVTVKRGDVMSVTAGKAGGEKCERCWKFFENLGSHADHPTLCGRCTDAVESLK